MFKENINAVDLDEIELLLSNRGIKSIFCMIDVYLKYVWIKMVKDKKTKWFFINLLK